mmetsp:Transcript_2661/g.5583  ORF Transcript_2661/g.5583 Transcript_2661/m.5583 type:complete len:224 (-) Transcript_2661:63-734(-)
MIWLLLLRRSDILRETNFDFVILFQRRLQVSSAALNGIQQAFQTARIVNGSSHLGQLGVGRTNVAPVSCQLRHAFAKTHHLQFLSKLHMKRFGCDGSNSSIGTAALLKVQGRQGIGGLHHKRRAARASLLRRRRLEFQFRRRRRRWEIFLGFFDKHGAGGGQLLVIGIRHHGLGGSMWRGHGTGIGRHRLFQYGFVNRLFARVVRQYHQALWIANGISSAWAH